MDALEFHDPADIRAYLTTHYPEKKLGEIALILSPRELQLLKADDERIREERYMLGEPLPEEGLLTFPRDEYADD
jgi:hypothetical protein